ncbi:variant 2, THO complex subunit 3 [Lathyrus oleraceus]|uniref:Variant 2, THO complex subunit 3 n=1 Tax=Pisum sativum TaxID=3888 RepID=A0A9D4WWB7_PEA|nr:variant 2, THO complex subunit 3 [Pisum sativum]
MLFEDLELQVSPTAVSVVRNNTNGSAEVLIQWQDLPEFEATWEPMEVIKDKFTSFHLEDKVSLLGGRSDSTIITQDTKRKCLQFNPDSLLPTMEEKYSFKNLHSREYSGHKKKVHSVAWNCIGTKLASGSVDQTARIWHIEPHHGHGKVKDIELKGHTDSVDQLCWDPKHPDLIATASGDKTVRLWDARSGKCSQQAELSGENINITYKPDGTHVAVGNRDDELTILDVRKFKPIHRRKFNYESDNRFVSWCGSYLFPFLIDINMLSTGRTKCPGVKPPEPTMNCMFVLFDLDMGQNE